MPDFPDIGGAFVDALEPLLRPLLEVRDRVITWPTEFTAQMNLWLAGAVTYVGDRWWAAVAQWAERMLRQVTSTNDFTHILSEVPALWTWQNPVVWSLWAVMTGSFLAFLGPQLAALLATASHQRRQGAPWGDLFDDVFQVLLGVGAALLSPILGVLIILVFNVLALLIVQDSTVLPGMPTASTSGQATANAGLLALYATIAALLLLERVSAVAIVMLWLVLSGWGLGSSFWPRFGNWWGVWRRLGTVALGSMLIQLLLFRLGGETINRVLRDAPAETTEGNFLGLVLGLSCLGLCLLAPALLGGAYAASAVVGMARRAARTVSGPAASLARGGSSASPTRTARTAAPSTQ